MVIFGTGVAAINTNNCAKFQQKIPSGSRDMDVSFQSLFLLFSKRRTSFFDNRYYEILYISSYTYALEMKLSTFVFFSVRNSKMSIRRHRNKQKMLYLLIQFFFQFLLLCKFIDTRCLKYLKGIPSIEKKILLPKSTDIYLHHIKKLQIGYV